VSPVPERGGRRNGSRRSAVRFHALVIESDPDYRSVIAHVVQLAGGQSESVATVQEGRKHLGGTNVDVVIVGLGADASVELDSISDLRSMARCPLIMLHESFDEARPIYEAGVDQILPKPFVPGALVGAIQAELRGPSPTSVLPAATMIQIGGVTFDGEIREVRQGVRKASFSRREWELLTFFLANTNRYYESKGLLGQVWEGSVSAEQFRTYIGRIRRKLSPLQLPLQLGQPPGSGVLHGLRARGECIAPSGCFAERYAAGWTYPPCRG